jgi:hypothetical protein
MKKTYEAPQVELVEVEIEKGFAGSDSLENPTDGGQFGW